MRKYEHVAVVMGGWSAERDVSLKSGAACSEALGQAGYRVTQIDWQKSPNITEILQQLKPDVIFNALHGRGGEDGMIQGLFETLEIPYTHSGVLASAGAMNKDWTRRILTSVGIPVAEGQIHPRSEFAKGHPRPPPYVVKPISEGSSVGIMIVKEGQPVPQELMRSDWCFGEEVLVEKFIPGLELTCAIIQDKATDIIDIQTSSDNFYDYEEKYIVGRSKKVVPAKIKENIYHYVQRISLQAHQALGCRGVSRSDFRYDDSLPGTSGVFCLEINTQPGMTSTSSVPVLAGHRGLSFQDLVSWLVEDASCCR